MSKHTPCTTPVCAYSRVRRINIKELAPLKKLSLRVVLFKKLSFRVARSSSMSFSVDSMNFATMFCTLSAILLYCQARMSAFVCITGQLSRLELGSKLEHLFAANVGEFDIDVMLVLANSTRFTNNFVPVHRSTSVVAVVDQLLRLRVRSVWNDTRPQSMSPEINEEYLIQLDKFNMTAEARRGRANNHHRQWEAMGRCWSPRAANQMYDVYLRIRDDSYFWAPLSLALFAGKPGVHVPRCNSYAGINDRGALIVGKENAQSYFTQPIAQVRRPIARYVLNPETYLLFILTSARIAIHLHCDYSLTFISSHMDKQNRICTTPQDLGIGYSGPLMPRSLQQCTQILAQCAPPHIELPVRCNIIASLT